MAKKTKFEDVDFEKEVEQLVAFDQQAFGIAKKDGKWSVFVIKYDEKSLRSDGDVVQLHTTESKQEAIEQFRIEVANNLF